MKILLDTNVWRYLADSGRQSQLNSVSKRSGYEITICPAIVSESLRIGDPSLRGKVVELQTRRCWNRLMPDSFLEFEDIKSEICRTHPEWILTDPDHSGFRKLAYNWSRITGGWWSFVRENVDICASKLRPRDDLIINQIRDQSRQMRDSVLQNKKPMVGNWLPNFEGSWKINGETVLFEGWRVYAYTIWKNMFSSDETTRQWMGCHIDINRMLNGNPTDFFNFWHHEATVIALHREWLRATLYAMQADRKVTDGNPLDATIGVHLVDVDLVISADRNFISMIKRCHDEAPFVTADGLLLRAGNDGIDDLFQFLSSEIKATMPN